MADALGVPVEFQQRGSYHVTQMQGYGTYQQPAGSWSDDSSLTLILLANLVQAGTMHDMMRKMVTWLTQDAYTPAQLTFDVGHSTQVAIQHFMQGSEPEMAGDASEMGNGNGALMRIAPLAIVLEDEADLNTRFQLIRDTTFITHRHPRALIGSVLYVELLRHLLSQLPLETALQQAFLSVQQLSLPRAEVAHYQRLRQPDFWDIPEQMIHSSGYVVDSLEAAVWVAGNADSLKDAMLTAVNLGEDTDTIAQLSTMIYWAQHPDAVAPKEWVDHLILPTNAEHIIDQFAQKYGDFGRSNKF
ncbi:ADP-ribosylglycohydrolase family protein [Lacticaseibacillus saniviri]|uniref:ADP-ribosylglycohydrolase family protein n=1 Tax=Lacticaseibacillus saniviri TaxID=931533 RepID=UPI0009E685CB|nr:ADP-ribosylglycohydrolase family protein [Lacticaseibacillus saniviri]